MSAKADQRIFENSVKDFLKQAFAGPAEGEKFANFRHQTSLGIDGILKANAKLEKPLDLSKVTDEKGRDLLDAAISISAPSVFGKCLETKSFDLNEKSNGVLPLQNLDKEMVARFPTGTLELLEKAKEKGASFTDVQTEVKETLKQAHGINAQIRQAQIDTVKDNTEAAVDGKKWKQTHEPKNGNFVQQEWVKELLSANNDRIKDIGKHALADAQSLNKISEFVDKTVEKEPKAATLSPDAPSVEGSSASPTDLPKQAATTSVDTGRSAP